MSDLPEPQSPELLRRLLRAKDRMDAASHEDWPAHRPDLKTAVLEKRRRLAGDTNEAPQN